MGILDKLLRREQQVEEEVVEKQETFPEPAPPRGRILDVQEATRARLLKLIGSLKRSDYTVKELRDAAKLPLIAGIIETIIREVLSHKLVVEEKDPADDDRPKDMLEATFAHPNPTDRTFRIAMSSILRDLMVVGRSPVELLRSKSGQAGAVARAYLAGEISRDEFMKQVKQAKRRPGPVRGFIAYDPGTVFADVDDNGTLRNPAFYDVSKLGPFVDYGLVNRAQLRKLPNWTADEMLLILCKGTTDKARRMTPPSSVEEAYPIIDILYAMLILLRDKLDKPQMDKLVSFVIPKDAKQPSPQQLNTLVETLREDLASGTLPVLEGVEAVVADIGMGDSFQVLWEILAQLEIIAWQIFGAGGVQMLRMEGQGRQAATQQMEAAKKQAVGYYLSLLLEDFIAPVVVRDPHSPYGGLLVKWIDESAMPTKAERLKEYEVFMKYGTPPGVFLDLEYPGVFAQLESKWGDPYTIVTPQLQAALAKAGLIEMEGGEEEEEETEAEEEAEEEEKSGILEKVLETIRAIQKPAPVHVHLSEQKEPSQTIVNVPERKSPEVHTQVDVHVPEQSAPEVKIEHVTHVAAPDVKIEPTISIPPTEVTVDAPIHVDIPEIKVDPTINVESPKIEPVINVHPPDVKIEHAIHVAAPEVKVEPVIKVAAPEVNIEPNLVAELDFSKAKLVPDVHVDVHLDDIRLEAELHAPDETIETETMIERDENKLIRSTTKTSKKKRND